MLGVSEDGLTLTATFDRDLTYQDVQCLLSSFTVVTGEPCGNELYMGRYETGWSPDDREGIPWSLSFDPITRKIYYISHEYKPVGKWMNGVQEIDLDSWTPDQHWSENSTPALPQGDDFGVTKMYNNTFHDGKYYSMRYHGVISVIDPVANTIEWMASTNSKGLPVNITNLFGSGYLFSHFDIDKESNRMVLYWTDYGTYGMATNYSYIDLDNPATDPYDNRDMGANDYYNSGWWSVPGQYPQYFKSYLNEIGS